MTVLGTLSCKKRLLKRLNLAQHSTVLKMLRRLSHSQHCPRTNASVSELLHRLASQNAGGKNVAQGDTTKPSAGNEVGNVAKGDELTLSENLKYNTITHPAQAFEGDLRSTSGLGLGDGLYTHTSKWLQVSRQCI